MSSTIEDGPVEIRPRNRQLAFREIEQKLLVCPSPEQFRDGCIIPAKDVDRILAAAQDLSSVQVYADKTMPPEKNFEMMSRAVRLMQVALDLQLSESSDLTSEFNKLQEDYSDLEERERQLRVENDKFRERFDEEDTRKDPDGARRKLEELQRRVDLYKLEAETYASQIKGKDEQIAELESLTKNSSEMIDRYKKLASEAESKLLRLTHEHTDLQTTFHSMASKESAAVSKGKMEESLRQQDWKIERLTRDNRALELQNTELRSQLQEIKSENLEVSEKIVLLDEEVRQLSLKKSETESRLEVALQDKDGLLQVQEGLRAEVQEKINLMEEFEDKFTRQFHSWEEEKSNLTSQIDGLRREARGLGKGPGLGVRGRAVPVAEGEEDERVQEVLELREELLEAREREVLLLEAYEQLEVDCGKEIDKALLKEREERSSMERKVAFLQSKLDEEREQVDLLKRNQEHLEDDLKSFRIRNLQYEDGVYGLPQAVEEIHALKDALYKEEGRVRGLVDQMNKLSSRAEDLSDENGTLRKMAGVKEGAHVDTKDVRMHKEAQISQLRSLNALLERQVADLEEERRKLRSEMKFRAKYHGQAALELGLTPDQLLLLEQYVEGLKHGTIEEARLVDQLSKRIEFLEVRLSEVMAYADIPPSMRPALSEFDPVSVILGGGGGGGGQAHPYPHPGQAHPHSHENHHGGGSGGLGNIKVAQIEAVKAAILRSLGSLRDLRQSASPADKAKIEALMSQLTDAEKAVDAIQKEHERALRFPTHPNLQPQPQGPYQTMVAGPGGGGGGMVAGDVGYLADEVADQLRARLRDLARQLADLQVDVTKKDAQIKALSHQKQELEHKFSVPMSERQMEFIPRSDYEEQELEVQGLKDQLVGVLEELSARERELQELQDVHHRYQNKMQTYCDQVRMLYRDHSQSLLSWKADKHSLEKRVAKLSEEAAVNKAEAEELRKGLGVLEKSSNATELHKEVVDTVRRMAVVQVKHAKLARELEASSLSERGLQSQVEEMQEEVRDVATTCRARMRWLEAASEQAHRRVDQLFRELQSSAPLAPYRSLVRRHAKLQGDVRKLLEEQADGVIQCEDLVELRHELVVSMKKYDKSCDDNSELKEKKRQLELKLSALHSTLSTSSSATAPPSSHGSIFNPPSSMATEASTLAIAAKAFDSQLSQELVSSRVMQESAVRRLSLVEGERDRIQKSLQETQALVKDLEHRISVSSGELSTALASSSELQTRMLGCLTKVESEALTARLTAAEEAASKAQASASASGYKAEEAERKLTEATRDKRRHLAEITTLKAALRDVSSRSEQGVIIGKLHLEVDHLRTKEGLARNALNRSELERLELDREVKRLRVESTRSESRIGAHQDQARWADKQRHEAQAQLEVGLAARTEQWKANLWASKIQQLKARNDAAADGLDLARRRMKKLEDQKEEVELKLSHSSEVELLIKKGTNELTRETARLNESLMHLKLDRGKLQREEVLLREKVHYVERVNAELHELLERYEAEFFKNQLQLEADRQAEASHARLLQDDVVKLQERIASLLASGAAGGGGGGGGASSGGGGGGPDVDAMVDQLRMSREAGSRIKGLMTDHSRKDREVMLRQVEALKTARQEAEFVKSENVRLQGDLTAIGRELADVRRHHSDALTRLREQSESSLYSIQGRGPGHAGEGVVAQMKAVAEATILELKARLGDRDRQLGDLHTSLELTKAQWLAQHQTDRDEIGRLNQALFDRNNASIEDLKGVLGKLPGVGEDAANNRSLNEELEKLKELTERRKDELNILRNQLDQKDAAVDLVRSSYESQLKILETEVARLQSELDKPRDDAPSRILADKLTLELRRKDERMRKLDAAIKQVQAELSDALKRKADDAIQGSNWRQQERLDERLTDLEAQNRKLTEELQMSKDEVAALTMHSGEGGEREHASALAKLQAQLVEVKKVASELEVELSKERNKSNRMKSAEKTIVDLTTGMSIEAKKQIDELNKRINVLEKQNQQLKVSSGRASVPSLGDHTSAPPPPPPPPPTTAAEDAARSSVAVAQWEESKRLNQKIEVLRKKVAQKTEEALEACKESDRVKGQVEKLQVEMSKQSALIKDLDEKLKRAIASGPKDQDKLKGYIQANLDLEQQVDELRRQLAASQEGKGVKEGGKGGEEGGGDAKLKRDSDLFELRLARDQAQAKADAYKVKLDELLSSSSSAPGTSTRSKPGVMSAKEAELMSTIANLKAALEKSTTGSVPSTKYMAEVAKRKEAMASLAQANVELDKLKQQATTAARMMAELQTTNAQLRSLSQQQQQGAKGAATASASVGSQLASLEAMLEKKELEVSDLRQAIEKRDVQLQRMNALAPSLSQLRKQLSDLEAENKDLKSELNAFDPAFFEEIEDMKHEHHQLTIKVSEYESLIRELSNALGAPLPAGVPRR